MQAPFYESLQAYFDEHKVTKHTPATIRKAVIAIRSSKLPDPAKVPNNGSFFGNPIIDKNHYEHIKAAYKDVVAWEVGKKQYKISAGWLIEKAGFKGYKDTETGMAIWPKQSLVFINEKAHTTADLLDFRQKILDKVQTMFAIMLEQEPELLP